ncbi:EamA family transporter [Micromonospora tulbaghiae]|uniref:EamA family transporter n=1 Tax=Micromonospora tulbaghiae TaxID=479978 RepID=A0AAW4JTY2_9ACTN|nr:EamA family transporter [Micromonospora sp. AMSO1212t]MBO4143505.1 EamA family transporter [Micromonospora tulbaghiae]SCF06220.1 probable blue pigment (indigoidine) exporter [Micromonospora tulbaghiae]
MDRRWTDVALTAAAPVTWGTTYLVTAELLPPDRPLWAGAIRALPAGLLLLALTRRRPHGLWWGRTAVLGALNIGVFFPLLFLAAYRLPGGTAAVLGATQPLLVAVLTVALLRDRPTRPALVAAVAAPLGVALVVLRPGAGLDPLGVTAGLAGAVAMAAGLVLTRRWGRPPGVGVLAATSWQLVAGGLMIVPVAAAVEGAPPAPDGPALLGYAWLGLAGTALAYVLWFRGAARLPVSRVSVLGALSPLTAAALGWVVLGEALDPVQLTGFAVAVAAMVLAQMPDRSPRPQPAGDADSPAAALAGTSAGGVRSLPTTLAGTRQGSGRAAWWLRGQPARSRRQSSGHASAATPSGSTPAGSCAAAASGSVNRCAAAGPAAYDRSSSHRTSSAVQPRPERAAISRTSRRPTRVSSS